MPVVAVATGAPLLALPVLPLGAVDATPFTRNDAPVAAAAASSSSPYKLNLLERDVCGTAGGLGAAVVGGFGALSDPAVAGRTGWVDDERVASGSENGDHSQRERKARPTGKTV